MACSLRHQKIRKESLLFRKAINFVRFFFLVIITIKHLDEFPALRATRNKRVLFRKRGIRRSRNTAKGTLAGGAAEPPPQEPCGYLHHHLFLNINMALRPYLETKLFPFFFYSSAKETELAVLYANFAPLANGSYSAIVNFV